MAIGISPKFVQEYTLDNLLENERFLALGIEAAKMLKWDISLVSETGFIAYTKFSMSSWSEQLTFKIDKKTVNIKSECTGSQLMDWGKNKRNVVKLLSIIEELKKTFTDEELQLKVVALRKSYVPKEEDVLSKPPSSSKEQMTSIFSLFIPREGYFVTPILINSNILIYILMVASGVNFFLPDTNSLIKWGANFRPITLERESWRLITCFFLHIGIIHLLLNMYALLFIGLLLEPYLGRARFLAAYILTGLSASVASLWWNDLTISAGASGAIFGMYGVFLAMLTTNLIEKSERKALLTSIAVFVGYNLIYGLKPESGIDNAAHIGGLVSGLIFGYALIPSLKKPQLENLKYRTIGIFTVLVLCSSFITYNNISNDIGVFQTKMKEFASNESIALEVYKKIEYLPSEKALMFIKEQGIYYWNKELKLLEGLKKLDLPEKIVKQNKLLKEYCELRIKSYELMYKAISENSEQYKDQLVDYNKQISEKIGEIGGNK